MSVTVRNGVQPVHENSQVLQTRPTHSCLSSALLLSVCCQCAQQHSREVYLSPETNCTPQEAVRWQKNRKPIKEVNQGRLLEFLFAGDLSNLSR